jgi:hypothetical protein
MSIFGMTGMERSTYDSTALNSLEDNSAEFKWNSCLGATAITILTTTSVATLSSVSYLMYCLALTDCEKTCEFCSPIALKAALFGGMIVSPATAVATAVWLKIREMSY